MPDRIGVTTATNEDGEPTLSLLYEVEGSVVRIFGAGTASWTT